MKRKLTVYLFCILFSVGCATPSQKINIYKFTGNRIYNQNEGFIVQKVDEYPDYIVIKSTLHEYAITLPYSNSWNIKTGKTIPLFANNDESGSIVSIMIGDYPDVTQQAYCRKLLDNFSKDSKLKIQDPIYIDVADCTVLRYKASHEDLKETVKGDNVWSWNYWVAFKKKSKWYSVHWSKSERTLNNIGADNEGQILKILCSFADYNKKLAENF